MSECRTSPSALRNRAPILDVLQRILPKNARVLEIASGTGEHAVFFARAMPMLDWQPSDPDPGAQTSIAAWIETEGVANVRPPLAIDTRARDWGVAGPLDAIVAINVIHISPWEATLGLMRGAQDLLRQSGILFTYGAYKRNGRHTAPSNEAFDAWLRERDSTWGVRDIEEVVSAARAYDLSLAEIVEMPANNFSLVFARN